GHARRACPARLRDLPSLPSPRDPIPRRNLRRAARSPDPVRNAAGPAAAPGGSGAWLEPGSVSGSGLPEGRAALRGLEGGGQPDLDLYRRGFRKAGFLARLPARAGTRSPNASRLGSPPRFPARRL